MIAEAIPRREISVPAPILPKPVADVTVVISTRNGHSRGFLDEAIRSVLGQTTLPAEIILVDDGSTDDTAAEVQQMYPSVTVLNNAGTGLASARNTGIRAARHAWIALLDDDDVWCPTKLAEQLAQVAASAQPESTIWVSPLDIIGKNGSAPVRARFGLHLARWPGCLVGCPIAPSGVLFSREFPRRFGAFNESISISSANEYWVRCLRDGATVCFSEHILVHYRKHLHQMTEPSRSPSVRLRVAL